MPYRVLVLDEVPQQGVPLLTHVVQVDVCDRVARGELVLVYGRACRGGRRRARADTHTHTHLKYRQK